MSTAATSTAGSASAAAANDKSGKHDDIAAARRFLEYVDASPTPFHAVATTSAMLDAAGFERVKENELWDNKVKRGGKYYFTRNQSAIVAFAVGAKYEPGNGVHIVGAHTDSPNFQIKPVSRKAKEGYLQCGVETYGGGIWASWFDRDLGVAGRVIVSDSKKHDAFTGKLVHIKRPILRIPTLAIHLNRTVNEAFKFNVEDNTVPVLGLATEQLNKRADEAAEATKVTPQAVGSPVMAEKHHPVLLDLLAAELGISVEQIQDFELSLYDTQPASIGGINNEFIHSPRLDNQMSCFCATEALIDSLSSADSLNASSSIRAIALFDNEEVGSVSTHGAESNMLPSLIQRLVALPVSSSSVSTPAASNVYEQAIARSFLLSSDMAHGFHPNYPSYYEENHRPKINQGPVIKTNVKQRYATTGPTAFLIRRIAQRAQVPLQSFVVKNDMPCGSTIGPMLSKLGIRTLDLGNPQLSMHSIRETCGTKDVEYKIQLFKHFFDSFEQVDAQLTID
ncbi:probable aspartyl aminopeptidase [Ustilago sp. UG-2017a]|nr:probable aspartyl aminopeptidase [Ustilago sp. UG-2017a]